MTTLPDPPALPPRPPRPLVVHAAVDAVVAFLALAVVLFILDIPLWVTAIVAVVLGIASAPLTRRAEERALLRREHSTPGNP